MVVLIKLGWFCNAGFCFGWCWASFISFQRHVVRLKSLVLRLKT